MAPPASLKTLAARWFAGKSTCLGEDPRTCDSLRLVLSDLGASLLDEQWGLAGAVALTVTTVGVAGRRLVVEQETYTGVTIRGPRDLVDAIEGLVRARQISALDGVAVNEWG